MESIIVFLACLFSFAAVLISLLFFLRYKKVFFFHVLLILFSFFLLSTNNLYATIYSPITNRTILCVFGAFLTLCFSYGIINFTFDLIQISASASIRKITSLYSLAVFIFAIIMIFISVLEKPALFLNILGIWIPTAFSLLISIIFHKRIDTGVFRKEKWIFVFLALLNLALSFILKSVPFIFIISISILIYHIFYKFYFSSPISKTKKKRRELKAHGKRKPFYI